MKIISADTETAPILPGLLAPPLAVLSWADENGAELVARDKVSDWWMNGAYPALMNTDAVLVGHNWAYDAVVLSAHDERILPTLFEMYDARKIRDTMLNEQLYDIGRGRLKKAGYSLDVLAKKYLGVEMDKSTWRMKYGTLADVPLEQWPQGAKDYPLGDADAPRRIYEIQAERTDEMANAPEQAKYAFSQQLMCTWGIRTDPERVREFRGILAKEQAELAKELRKTGLLVADKKGKETKPKARLFELVTKAYGGEPPMTDKGSIKTDKKTLLDTDDELLHKYSEFVGNEKLLSTYLPVLDEGTVRPINSTFRLLESGRRGASKNMQTPPKKEGVRECYVPRPGFVFCSCDYDSLELRALAQINLDLFGESPLADLYIADPNADPHTRFAAEYFLHIPYEEALRRKEADDPEMGLYRQAAKAFNFGLPGGLGVKTFMQLAKNTYGYEMTENEAWAGKNAWVKFMRMAPFFDFVRSRAESYGDMTLPRSERKRGGLGFCDCANYLFQGPAADGACEAHYMVAKECYIVRESPLYGCRIVNFMHDELILEMPELRASAAARRLSEVMNAGMRKYIPDVPITSSATLMRCWSKKAKKRFDSSGNLLVWEKAAA